LREREIFKKKRIKAEIPGSETVFEKIKRKTPWIFGNWLRKPKIDFPKFKFRRLSLPMPSRLLGLIVIYTILFILQTGIVYLIVREPPALGKDSRGDPEFVIPENIHDAYIIESIVASILLLFSSFGFIILFYASKYVYNKKFGDWILVIGILMILITFFMLQFMLDIKTPKPNE
jgi:magnesium-transporting ATPase (P-type)